MGKTIFITEKPSVAMEYKKVLGVSGDRQDGYIEGHSSKLNKDVIITWAVGHLIEICSPEEHNENWKKWSREYLPMIPSTFKYKPSSDTYKQFKVVKDQYTRPDIDCIYYAGDSGREGIYIQALIRNQIFKKAPAFDEKVVWIDSYTEESILNGIKNAKPYSAYQPMIDSGYSRAKADWLIGMNLSRAFSLTSGGYKNNISVGRVMTPTLALIVDRQREIDAFVKTDYYGIKTNFASWKADKQSRFYGSPLLYNENGFLKKEKAEELKAEFEQDMKLTVSDVKTSTKTEYAPYNFNLADLQNYCSKSFHISPDNTLKIAQSLYEKKFTTYPRTDSRFLSTAVAKEYKDKFGFDIPARYIDDDKITDHYAIIPTFAGDKDELAGLEQKVYLAILKRFNDTMKPPYIYDSISVAYEHSNKEHFYESFKIVKQKGFKEGAEEADADVKVKPIPKKGDTVPVTAYSINPMETKPPVAYTTGSLIMAMEKAGRLIEDEELREQIKTCGIGTSATRAGIIEKLVGKSYITVEKSQKVAPTEEGKRIVDVVRKFDETLVSPIKTADMEQKLANVENGSNTADRYMEDLCAYIKNTTKTVLDTNKERVFNDGSDTPRPEHDYNCPCCNKTLKFGRFGWYCDKKDNGCGFSFGLDIFGHKMTEDDLNDLLTNGETKPYDFTWSNGKTSKAKVVVKKNEHKTGFDFNTGSSNSGSFTKSSYSKSSSGSSSSSNTATSGRRVIRRGRD
jgi:DNA topoisomerase-3